MKDDPVATQVRESLQSLRGIPDVERVRRRARAIRMRRVASGVVVAALVSAGIAIPLATLADLGGSSTKAASPGAAADSVYVACDESGAHARSLVVRPQSDGVHVVIDNTTATRGSYEVGNLGGENLPPGESHVTLPTPPGPLTIRCNGGAQRATIRVQDPEGIWVSPELSCPDWQGYSTTGQSEPPDADLVHLASDHLRGLAPSDQLQLAGYPDANERFVRVVRADSTVAVTSFDFLDGSWHFKGTSACNGSGIH
jgi:hypothetical protein